MEERIGRLEGRTEEMSKRLNHIESDLRELGSDLKSNSKLTVGLLITMWVTVILAMMLK